MLFDFHNDFLTSDVCDLDRCSLNQSTVYAVFTTHLKDPATFLYRLKRRRGSFFTAIEDLGYIVPEKLLGAENTLRSLKPLYASLTWNDANSLAGGCASTEPLTKYGKEMLSVLANCGILLDTAHLNRLSFYQAVDTAMQLGDLPVICSHTCFDGVFNHRRNLDDHQIRLIIESGGIVGLTLVPQFMGRQKASIPSVIRQIDYFAAKFGIENLCFGTDFYGCDSPAIPTEKAFTRLEDRLLSIGYKQSQIDQIFYQNAYNFLSKLNQI